jgi:cytoskeletal protein CcmA (bactofilin family)
MPEFRTEPLIVPVVSGLLPAGERDRRVALTSFRSEEDRVQVPTREVICYECGQSSQVPSAALSANCIHCHAHLNMADVQLRPGSRRLTVRTLGDVQVQAGTKLSNLSIVCRHMEVNGPVSGSFRCTGTLSFNASTRVEGSISAGKLVVDKGVEVELAVGAAAESAEIYGSLKGRLQCKGLLHIYRSGAYAGVCKAADVQVDPGGRFDDQSRF